jgi:hypothetical protein
MALWGSNKYDYIKEAKRILVTNGILYIGEPVKKWCSDPSTVLNADKLEKMLTYTGFTIKTKTESGYIFQVFTCVK